MFCVLSLLICVSVLVVRVAGEGLVTLHRHCVFIEFV